MNNIFNFATSELSQDALICYLLNFAHVDHRNEDPLLTKCAEEFLRTLLDICDENEELIVTNLKKQHENIDVLVEVNKDISIIIEDKIHSHQSLNQIENYKEKIKQKSSNKIVTVYYKMIDQPHPEKVDKHIERRDMIKLFDKYRQTNNTIIQEYYQHLKKIENEVNEYNNLAIDKWKSPQYRGFFQHITDSKSPVINLEKGYSWGYVPNKNEGFMGLWWYFLEGTDLEKSGLADKGVFSIYPQIENEEIVIKIRSTEPTNDIKWSLYHYLNELEALHDFKKKRFRTGEVMSIGSITYNESNYEEKIGTIENALDCIKNGKFKIIDK